MNVLRKRAGVWIVYSIVLCSMILLAHYSSIAITTISEQRPLENRNCIVIDAGHGGIDGGAVSCSGVYESHINLQIALRLDDLLHLLGMQTKMIRTEDISIYTSGNTIAAKKASDLKERVKIANETENGILLSIHQNYYTDGRYSGAQMFYASSSKSSLLAEMLQNAMKDALDPANNRQIKRASGIYLMEHVKIPAVLVECGFLSNAEEEARLTDASYQKKLCCVIAAVCSRYLSSNPSLA